MAKQRTGQGRKILFDMGGAATQPVSAGRAAGRPAPSPEKAKATFYLDTEVLETLEEGWLQLRRLAAPGRRKAISKSAIVEAALRLALAELAEKERDSELVEALLGNNGRIP